MSEHNHLPEPRWAQVTQVAEMEAFIERLNARRQECVDRIAELEKLKEQKEYERELIRARIDELNERANKRIRKGSAITWMALGALLLTLVQTLIGWV